MTTPAENRAAAHASRESDGGDYRIQLPAYAGPLDLLLHLVKRHEIDLGDIPIATLTEQYLDHLKVIELMDMDQAGEFLVMAATLVEIKSQMLVPRPEDEQAEGGDATDQIEDRPDPRLELVQQLLAYKRYKDAAVALERRQDAWSARFPAAAKKAKKEESPAEENAPPIELDLEDVHVLDLCEAFARLLDSVGARKTEHEVTYDETPISLHATDIYDRLERDGGEQRRLTLRQLFEGRRNRSELVGLFLATLELVRQHKVRVIQENVSGDPRELALEARPEAEHLDDPAAAPDVEDESRDWRDPDTGEVTYDWPDEQGRRRYERRQRIRAAREAQGKLEHVPMLETFDEDDLDEEDFDADAADKQN